jgi:GDP-4-dehydro-6-deoxy-D-mannose reductase
VSTRTLVITGANGFVGAHVAARAAADGVRVIGVGREPAPSDALAPYAAAYLGADLETTWPVVGRVDAVIHLAGLAAVGASFREPQRYLNVNSGIMTTMCEALLRAGQQTRVVVVSSGAVYAPPASTRPITEGDGCAPNSPYAVAKILVETQAEYYARRGIDTLVARPFNHIGPGQGPGFIVPDFTIALRDLPDDAALTVGNLDSRRDFTDVRDVAHAYLTLAFAPTHAHRLYNVASGESHSGREVLDVVAAALDRTTPRVVVDAGRLRPGDPANIIGSAARLRDEFGWRPTIGWRQSINDFVAGRG